MAPSSAEADLSRFRLCLHQATFEAFIQTHQEEVETYKTRCRVRRSYLSVICGASCKVYRRSTANMPSLQDLPLNIVHHLVQYIASSKTSSSRKDALSLGTSCKIFRGAILESTFLREVVLSYSREELEWTKEALGPLMRKKVK